MVRATWIVAAVLLVLVLAGGAFLLRRGGGTAARQSDVKQFSERFAVNLATYDYRHLDQDLSRVRAMTVSRFRSDYQGIQGDSTIGRAFKSNQAISTAKVASGPFVASLTKDDARVLLVVEQTTRGKSAPQPQTRRQQLDVFLVVMIG